jgi:thioredoxin reductase (NADPH)
MSDSPRPVMLTVDDDPQVLRAVRRDLLSAYGKDYRVLGAASGSEALALLDSLLVSGDEVALLISDQRMPEMTGSDFLLEATSRFPDAKRALLTAYADTDVAVSAINKIRLDYYLLKPWDPPQERLFPIVDDLLSDWVAQHRPRYQGIRVVGARVSAETHRLRDYFTRNEQPFQFLDLESDPEGANLAQTHASLDLPLVLLPGGEVLSNPDAVQLSERFGIATLASRPHYDTVVIGAGPAGLAAAVYSGSEGLSTLVVDAEVPGGQAGTTSRIENYLGFPSGLAGADLARRALTQARRFGAEFLYPVRAVGLRRGDPARIVTLSNGTEVSASSVILAMGVSYNRLTTPGAANFENQGLFYGTTMSETAQCVGREVLIIGGANSAGQAAIHIAKVALKVTILVRDKALDVAMSNYLVREIDALPTIEVCPSTEVAEFRGNGKLESVLLSHKGTGETSVLPAELAFTYIGATPHTDWLDGVVARDERGFLITGPDLLRPSASAPPWPVERPPYLLETSMPGVFAAGDVRAGSVKRVAAGVGEGATAISLVHLYQTRE